ncbi:MAG: tetratricopeptide repeat protein [Chloroflexota bacterium]|nr:tetratricopeptide repeat protein [Chloroflexota bacterium]
MYDQYPKHDVPQNNIVQRFFSQRWSAIALEIVMTIVITIAAGAAFDFFDPLDGSQTTSANSAQPAASAAMIEEFKTRNPLAFIKERGKAYIQERRFAAAEAMFDWAIVLAPDDMDSYSWRGYANMLAGEYLEAQADYRKVFEGGRNSFDANSALCWAYGETGDFANAEWHCLHALEIAFNRSEFAIALENLCWLQVEMGNYEEAAKKCRFSLEYAPEYKEAHALANYNMGRVLFAQGKTLDALPHFDEALRIGSTYPKMYLEISAIYDTLGHRSVAQASYAIYRELVGERGVAVGQANG